MTSDLLIIGGGPAGMAAALAASAKGKTVTVVDDNPRLGGQIWRAELGKTKSPEAAKLLASINAGKISIVNNSQVFAIDSENSLAAETPQGRAVFEYEKLIIATGARELFLPFPGWTLPGVMGAGGLQALVKGGLNVANKRVVIAGAGPLLLAVAEYLKSKGAEIAAIVEQASTARINRFALGLWRSPGKLVQAAALKTKLRGIPYLSGRWIVSVSHSRTGASAVRPRPLLITLNKSGETIECDYLACGFHFVPNTELAQLLGCEMNNGFVTVDEFQQTSVRNIYAAGEPTGICGLEASLVEGSIAGHAAADNERSARKLFAKRYKTRRFGELLNRAFSLRPELKTLADDATIVCRCEDVKYGRLRDFDNWRSAKLQTRCGMGPCQGRVCGAATEFMFGWEMDPPRPPVFPVKLENL